MALLSMLVINWTTVSKFNNLFTIIKALKINTRAGYPFLLFSILRLLLYILYIKHV